jgi:hypothetical protein
MMPGDLVRLNENRFEHPAYKNGVLYLVKNVLASPGAQWPLKTCLVELYTPEGVLVAFNMSELEVVSEAR